MSKDSNDASGGKVFADADGSIPSANNATSDESSGGVEPCLLSGESVLSSIKLMFSGAPLSEVLSSIVELIEAQSNGMFCTIFLLDDDGKNVRCAAAPGIPGFIDQIGSIPIGPKHASSGTAVYSREPVYVADILTDPLWDNYRHLLLPFGVRAAWARPLVSNTGKILGTFASYYTEVRSPSPTELQLIENASHIAGIAIERHVKEEELKSSEARKTAILDSALDCILTIDHEGRITEFNRAAESTFGYRRDDVLGVPLADVIVPPSFREQHRQGLAHYLATGKGRVLGKRMEMTAIRADGSEFPVELAITRISLDGPPSFTGYIRDITKRKKSEKALSNARSELAHMARVTSLGALTASIAHEVNQPLSGIITNASTCIRMLAAEPPNIEGARETARRTIRDGNRASEVVTRLRGLFAKTNSAEEPVDLNDVALEVISLTNDELQKSRVILQPKFADGLPPVKGDRVQLQQVVLNLLLNASDAMNGIDDRPRELLIKTRHDDNHGHVQLEVQDVGVGIEPQVAESLFEPFYTTKSGGMGIGLFVSRSIIERHNGRIWVTPNDGPGATFSFSLPCFFDDLST